MKKEVQNNKVNKIVEMINNDYYFADVYKLDHLEIIDLFSKLKLQLKEIEDNGYVHSYNGNVLISVTSENFLYISTKGLVTRPIPKGKNIYYAFKSQAKIMEIILEELIKLTADKYINYIGGETFEKFEELSISFLHNYIFYFELLCKAYLQLIKFPFKHTHDLEYLLNLVNSTSKVSNLYESLYIQNMNERIWNISKSLLKFAGENSLESILTKLKYGDIDESLCLSAEIDFVDIQLNIFLDLSRLETSFYRMGT